MGGWGVGGPRHLLGPGYLWCQAIRSCQVGSELDMKAGPPWDGRRQVPRSGTSVRGEPGGRLHTTPEANFQP